MLQELFWRKPVLIFLFLLSVSSLLSPSLVQAVVTTISNLPSVISQETFSLSVHIQGAGNGTNYLRVDLYKDGTTKYFGETFNGQDWYRGSDGQQYLPVNISEGSASATLQGQVGSPSVTEYDGLGQYRLRVRRYTASGSYTATEANATSGLVTLDIPVAMATPTQSPTPTPTITPTPMPVSYPNNIYISEFLPNSQSGEKEWVELYNANDFAVDLTEWKIDDQDGGSSPESFTLNLLGLSYGRVFFSSNKLNNDGDTVRLLKPDSTLADFWIYSSSQKAVSWAKNSEGGWVETAEPSPGEPNKFVPVGGAPHKNQIVELKKLVLGSKIELEAFVSVPLDIFSDDEFYVIDSSTGIKIAIAEVPEQKLKVGDRVHVASTIEESHSEKYIKSETYEILQTDLSSPEPVQIATEELLEANEGKLVKISGQYQKSDGDNFYIDDGSGLAKVYLKSSTGIMKLKMEKGDEIEVQGVVSQYGFLGDGGANYRLMPRFQSDLRNLSEEEILRGKILGAATELPITGAQSSSLSLILIVLGLALKAVLKFSGESG